MAEPSDGDAPVPPRNAMRAVRVTWAGLVVSIVETIVTVADRESLRRRIGQQDPAGLDLEVLVDIAAVSGLLAGVAATVFWLRLIRMIRRGGNWSRAATLALLVAVVLLPVIALTDLVPVLDAVLAGVWGILTIAVIVLLTIRVVARWT